MLEFHTYPCWVEAAQSWLDAREQVRKKVESESGSTIDISLEPIGSKSAEIRIRGRYIGASGAGAGVVNILFRYLHKHYSSDYVEVLDVFFECVDYSPE